MDKGFGATGPSHNNANNIAMSMHMDGFEYRDRYTMNSQLIIYR